MSPCHCNDPLSRRPRTGNWPRRSPRFACRSSRGRRCRLQTGLSPCQTAVCRPCQTCLPLASGSLISAFPRRWNCSVPGLCMSSRTSLSLGRDYGCQPEGKTRLILRYTQLGRSVFSLLVSSADFWSHSRLRVAPCSDVLSGQSRIAICPPFRPRCVVPSAGRFYCHHPRIDIGLRWTRNRGRGGRYCRSRSRSSLRTKENKSLVMGRSKK